MADNNDFFDFESSAPVNEDGGYADSGFADYGEQYAEDYNTEYGQDEPINDEFSADEEEFDDGRRKARLPHFELPSLGGMNAGLVAALAALALCLILSIVSISSVNGLKSKIEESNYAVNAELQSVRQSQSEMLAHLAALEAAMDNTQTAISSGVSSKYIQITKQPSSTPTYVGRDAAMIFQVTADGKDLKFTWQKYDEVSGEWINMVFDLDGNNAELGVRLYDDGAKGVSELWTKVLTQKAFGTYRCVITDTMGSQVVTDTVQLTEKTA